MMKRSFVAGAVLTCVLTGSAMAADMPTKAPVARPACAAAWWQGGYIGVSGGGVSYTANRTDQDEALIDVATYVQKKSGGLVGGQVGYNWTNCNTFWGLEIDGSWSNTKVTTVLNQGGSTKAALPAASMHWSRGVRGLVSRWTTCCFT